MRREPSEGDELIDRGHEGYAEILLLIGREVLPVRFEFDIVQIRQWRQPSTQ